MLCGTATLAQPAVAPAAAVVQPAVMPAAAVATPSVSLVQRTSASIIGEVNPNPDASFPTVPANGDVNPYGVAFVPSRFPSGGPLQPGDALVSNFNDSSNLQGTGTTIVAIGPGGGQSVFYQGAQGLGLTTALGVLKRGFVLVGNVPATYDSDGNPVSVGQGSLLILDRSGNLVGTLSNPACWMAPGT